MSTSLQGLNSNLLWVRVGDLQPQSRIPPTTYFVNKVLLENSLLLLSSCKATTETTG